MAQAPHANNVIRECSAKLPLMVQVEYQKGKLKDTVSEIRYALSEGIAVLVNGWEPEDAMEFCLKDISYYKFPIEQEVTWQGV